MTEQTTEQPDSTQTTVATEVHGGLFKRRRRLMGEPPPVVIEIRLDVNTGEPAAAEPKVPVPPLPDSSGLLGRLGDEMRSRVDEIIGTAARIVEQRIDDLADSADAQIKKYVEDTVNDAMDVVINDIVEQRIHQMFGMQIDLSESGDKAAPTHRVLDLTEAGRQGDPHGRVIDVEGGRGSTVTARRVVDLTDAANDASPT